MGQYAFGKWAIEKLKEKMKKIIVLLTLLLITASANAESKLQTIKKNGELRVGTTGCLLYTSPSPRDLSTSRMPSSA